MEQLDRMLASISFYGGYCKVPEKDPHNWSNNMISHRAVWDRGIFYHPQDGEDQLCQRLSQAIRQVPGGADIGLKSVANRLRIPVSEAENDLCHRLAIEAGAVKGDGEIGMGSQGGEPLVPFWLVALKNEPKATHIDEELIRSRFADALYPAVTIDVEPLEESGKFWTAIENDLADMSEVYQQEHFQPWRDLMAWFKSHSEFKDAAFVFVGDSDHLSCLYGDDLPPGSEYAPCVLPRLVLGLTKLGSLCGLFGIVAQT